MKKKNPKDQKGKKQPQNINLFVPSHYLSSVQEETYLTCPEERAKDIKQYIPEAEPFEIPQEWEEKTEEEINEELLPPDFLQKEQSKDLQITNKKSIPQSNNKKKGKNKKDKDNNKINNNATIETEYEQQ